LGQRHVELGSRADQRPEGVRLGAALAAREQPVVRLVGHHRANVNVAEIGPFQARPDEEDAERVEPAVDDVHGAVEREVGLRGQVVGLFWAFAHLGCFRRFLAAVSSVARRVISRVTLAMKPGSSRAMSSYVMPRGGGSPSRQKPHRRSQAFMQASHMQLCG
jgi:hypothetical protein